MRPTAAQLSRRNSARSSRFPKSVASIIAMSDGRPDPAQSVRHDRACPRVRLLAAPPPKGPPSLGWRPDGPALLASPPVTVSPKRSLACRESIGPSSTELDEVLAKDRRRSRSRSAASTATIGPSTLTYLYGSVSVCTHRLNRPARSSSFPFRDVRPVMIRTSPPGSYEYQIGTTSGP